MDEFTKFNLLEGSFWVGLGVVTFVLLWVFKKRYRAIALTGGAALLLFGISDFIEIKKGSFLEPQLWWLRVWKVINIAVFIFVFTWYFKLRLTKTD